MTAELSAETRARKIKILIFDVDGVLTDGQIFVIPNAEGHGIEAKVLLPMMALGSPWDVSAAFASALSPSATPKPLPFEPTT